MINDSIIIGNVSHSLLLGPYPHNILCQIVEVEVLHAFKLPTHPGCKELEELNEITDVNMCDNYVQINSFSSCGGLVNTCMFSEKYLKL